MKKLASLLFAAVAVFACVRPASAQESASDVSASSSLLHRPTPGSSTAPAAAGNNKPLEANLSKDNKGKTLTTTFAPSDAKVYLVWSDGADAKGEKIKAVWKSEAGKELAEGEETTKGPGTVGSFYFAAPSGGFPAGKYSVELSVGSKVAKTLKFVVKK